MKINENLSLQAISAQQQAELYELMQKIYTPVYQDFWVDGGKWYLEAQYGIDNFQKELQEIPTLYTFINYQNKKIGILRIIDQAPLAGFEGQKAAKLHRFYIAPTYHRKGFGAALMQWIENRQRSQGAQLLWLEAMENQQAAMQFYDRLGFRWKSTLQLDFERMYPSFSTLHTLWKNIS